MKLKFSITGRIPSKKNSKDISIVSGGKRLDGSKKKRVQVRSSKGYNLWHRQAMKQLRDMRVPKARIDRGGIHLTWLKIYFPDKREADLTNKAESVMDLLVDYGLLGRDDWMTTGRLVLDPVYRKGVGGCDICLKLKEEVDVGDMKAGWVEPGEDAGGECDDQSLTECGGDICDDIFGFEDFRITKSAKLLMAKKKK